MRKWLYFDTNIPTDGQQVYVRLANNEYTPLKLYFDLPNLTFHTVGNIFKIPANWVLKWTPVTP